MSLKKDFIKEVQDKKKKIMMGLLIDLEYYKQFLTAHDEDKARDVLDAAQKEMAEEQKNVVKDKSNRIISDNRDLDKVNKIAEKIQEVSVEIDDIAGVKKEQLTHVRDLKNLKVFYNLVSNVSPEVDKELDVIENL